MIYRNKKSGSSTGNSGITAISVSRFDQFPNVELLSYTKDGTDTVITELLKGNGVISGGLVNWIEGLDFGISAAAYVINGHFYTSSTSKLTLSPADVTNPRIDIIIVDSEGVTSIIEGVASENPQKPTPDPETQIELTQILIPAGATEPTDVTGNVVYNEHVAGEFTPSASGVVVDFDCITQHYNGAKSADVGTITKGDTITFESATVLSFANFKNLIANIKLKALADSSYFLTAQFKLNGINLSNEVKLPFSGANITNWQTINLYISAFKLYGTAFNQVVLKWNKTGASVEHAGFYLDLIKLENGIDNPIPEAYQQADWKQTDATKRDYIKNKPDSPLSFDLQGLVADDSVILEEYTVHTANIIGIAVRCDAEKTAVINILIDNTTVKFNGSADIPISAVRTLISATSDNVVAIAKTITLVFKSGTANRITGTIIQRG